MSTFLTCRGGSDKESGWENCYFLKSKELQENTNHIREFRGSFSLLIMAALWVSFRKRNFLSFSTKSSATSQTTKDSLYKREEDTYT